MVEDRRLGIYRAATYEARTDFSARFRPASALEGVDQSYRFDWTGARFVMFVSDSRAIRDAAELRFPDGTTATLEPISDLSFAAPEVDYSPVPAYSRHPTMVRPPRCKLSRRRAPFTANAPADFTVETRLVLGGAQRFAIAAFAQDTTATIRGDRRDVRAEGYFQASDALAPT